VVELDIAGGNNTGTFLGNGQRCFVLGMHDDTDALQIEQDIDYVFLHAVDGGVFMQHTLDAAIDDRAATHRRQQNPS
jgi:hypothetical protein